MSKLFCSTGLVAGLMLLAVSLLTCAPVSAADNTADPAKLKIVMTVGEMCGGCVKKITKRFEGVEGIAKVLCSVEKKSVTLVPTQNVRLSPKGVWEAMEGIGKTPTKMVTPNGTFTSKPKSQPKT